MDKMQLSIDARNKPIFMMLIKYFNAIPSDEYSLSKGILLAGNVGTGKTKTVEVMHKFLSYMKNPNIYRLVESREIIRDFARSKFDGLEQYTWNPKLNQHSIITRHPVNICIDDLGLEKEQISNYGDKIDVISEFLIDRYNIFTDNKYGKFLHATTNLNPEQMKEKYGDRINDRFREMFNIILMVGKSRRN